MKFKLAIIGYGYWGPKLARNFLNSSKYSFHSPQTFSIETSKNSFLYFAKAIAEFLVEITVPTLFRQGDQ